MTNPRNELTADLDASLRFRQGGDAPLTEPDRKMVDVLNFSVGMLRRYERDPTVVRAFLLDLREHLERWHGVVGELAEKETARATKELREAVRQLSGKKP